MVCLETDSEHNVRWWLSFLYGWLTRIMKVAIYTGWGYTVRGQADFEAPTGDCTVYVLTKVPADAA
jgi:hypothetical protein